MGSSQAVCALKNMHLCRSRQQTHMILLAADMLPAGNISTKALLLPSPAVPRILVRLQFCRLPALSSRVSYGRSNMVPAEGGTGRQCAHNCLLCKRQETAAAPPASNSPISTASDESQDAATTNSMLWPNMLHDIGCTTRCCYGRPSPRKTQHV